MTAWLILTLLLPSVAPARPRLADPKDVIPFLNEHGVELMEDRVFYRWQSTSSGENLVAKGVMDEATNRYFMGLTDGIAAGPGLYVAGSELSSARYLPAAGGNLIEVRIKKGTRMIDLTDPAIEKASKRLGLKNRDFDGASLGGRPLLVQYSGDWLVGRDLTNVAEFRMYPGPDQKTEDVVRTMDKAMFSSREQIAKQIVRGRPELVRHLPRTGENLATLVHLLPEAEVQPLLRRTFDADQTHVSTRLMLHVVSSDAKLADHVLRDPDLTERAVNTFARLLEEPLGHEGFSFMSRAVARAPATDANHRHTKTLVENALGDPAIADDWNEIARRAVPLLDRLELSAIDRARIAVRIGELMDNAPQFGAPFDAIAAIARGAHLDDADWRSKYDVLARRARVVNRAAKTGTVSDVREALSEMTSARSMVDLVEHLRARVPDAAIERAVTEIASDHPAVLTKILEGPNAHRILARNVDRGFAGAFEKVYASARAGDAESRRMFLSGCIDTHVCAERLARAMTADRGAIVRDVRDLGDISNELRRLSHYDAALSRRLTKTIITAVDDPAALTSLTQQLPAFTAHGRELLGDAAARARQIGLDRFRTSRLIELQANFFNDRRVQRELILKAAENAANARDVREVALAARRAGVETDWLRKDLTRRFQAYGPFENDVEFVGVAELNLGRPRVATPHDCVPALARLLSYK